MLRAIDKEPFCVARYTAVNGVLVNNWNLFYARDRNMQEFKLRQIEGGVEVALGDERFILDKWAIRSLRAALEREESNA